MKQDENAEVRDISAMSVEDLFLGMQETFEEAQQRTMEENRSFAKTEFFRMDKLGIYRIRILPIAPNRDGTAGRKSYEYPVHQMLLELTNETAAGKQQALYVTVPRATDVGYSLDLIDTYRKLAVEQAKEWGDEKLAEKIGGGSFGGGLKFSYGHSMFVIDLNERAKGIQLLTLSHSQFKELDESRFKLWQKKLSKNPEFPCPISSVYNGYPVEIEKRKNGAKTEYKIDIDNEDTSPLSKEELHALMNGPRILEIIHRYSRYQLGATVVFLTQCDQKYEMKLMENDEMKQAVEKLNSELPKEDTSSFSFDKRTKENKDNASSTKITIDELFDRFEQLQDRGLGDKTEDGQELRTLIRTYIEQEELSVRVTRTITNKDLLELIEQELAGPSPAPQTEEEPAGTDSDDKPAEASRRRR